MVGATTVLSVPTIRPSCARIVVTVVALPLAIPYPGGFKRPPWRVFQSLFSRRLVGGERKVAIQGRTAQGAKGRGFTTN